VTRRELETWLRQQGFEELPGGKTSHRQFRNEAGVKILVPGHGPQSLTKKHLGLIVRQLTVAGFDRETVRRAFGLV